MHLLTRADRDDNAACPVLTGNSIQVRFPQTSRLLKPFKNDTFYTNSFSH